MELHWKWTIFISGTVGRALLRRWSRNVPLFTQSCTEKWSILVSTRVWKKRCNGFDHLASPGASVALVFLAFPFLQKGERLTCTSFHDFSNPVEWGCLSYGSVPAQLTRSCEPRHPPPWWWQILLKSSPHAKKQRQQGDPAWDVWAIATWSGYKDTHSADIHAKHCLQKWALCTSTCKYM